MTKRLVLTEDVILTKVTEKSFERGSKYYDSGMVESVVQRGSRLYAEVLGSEEDSYHIGVALQEGDFYATCTCPYDWEGYCKHIVAVLLTWIHDRDLVSVRVPIEDLLANLDADKLRALIIQMVECDPGLSETVDEFSSPVGPVS
jgi:uncharacterized Zn finger protein